MYLAQVLWPAHCVQESWGAELHKELKVHPKGRVVHKGINPEVDSYSAFFDNAKLGKTSLEEMIKEEEVSDVYVCGIATDVCVGKKRISVHFVITTEQCNVGVCAGSTAFHANELGFRTILIDDCSRGIDMDCNSLLLLIANY